MNKIAILLLGISSLAWAGSKTFEKGFVEINVKGHVKNGVIVFDCEHPNSDEEEMWKCNRIRASFSHSADRVTEASLLNRDTGSLVKFDLEEPMEDGDEIEFALVLGQLVDGKGKRLPLAPANVPKGVAVLSLRGAIATTEASKKDVRPITNVIVSEIAVSWDYKKPIPATPKRHDLPVMARVK